MELSRLERAVETALREGQTALARRLARAVGQPERACDRALAATVLGALQGAPTRIHSRVGAKAFPGLYAPVEGLGRAIGPEEKYDWALSLLLALGRREQR